MQSQRVKMFQGGKLVIPADFRRAMGVGPGDTLIVDFDNGELRLRSLAAGIRQAQDVVRRFNPSGRSMVDELIDERRIEKERE